MEPINNLYIETAVNFYNKSDRHKIDGTIMFNVKNQRYIFGWDNHYYGSEWIDILKYRNNFYNRTISAEITEEDFEITVENIKQLGKMILADYEMAYKTIANDKNLQNLLRAAMNKFNHFEFKTEEDIDVDTI